MSGAVIPFDRGRLRDDVRQALADPLRVAELLGLTEGSKRESTGILVRCPAHQEKDPSCSITRGPDGTVRARCFACDFAGDLFSLVAATRGLDARRDFPAVLRAAAELAGLDPGAPPSARPSASPARSPATPAAHAPPQPPADLGALWAALPAVDQDGFEYLRGRGLEDAADLCRGLADILTPRPPPPVGHDRDAAGQRTCGGAIRCSTCRWEYASSGYALALDLRDADGRVVAIQARNIRAEKGGERDNRFLAIGPTSAGTFGDPARIAAAHNVIVAEGMTDSLAALVACRAATVTTVAGIAGVNAGAALEALQLRGKRVLVASDPDAAGDLLFDGRTEAQAAAETARSGKPVRAVRGLADRLQAIGAIPIRARPAEGTDLASMRADGHDLVAFLRRVLSEAAGFRSASVRLVGDRERRLAIAPRLLTLGVRFFDVALGGIAPSDVVLLGGISGHGKTEMARLIAQANAAAGKRVHYFALEDDEPEIEQRAKYVVLAEMVMGQVGGSRFWDRLNFLDWSYGRIDDITGPFEEEADRCVAELHRNLFTRYPGDGFTIDDFERAYLTLGDNTDLVVVDHFHYLDFGENENRAAKIAMRRLRELVKRRRRPILLVAHIRKAERAGKRLIPVLDDFHGSSDVVKMATKAILIAPATDRPNTATHLWKTYLSAGKCRVEGSRARYAACTTFDARRRTYDDSFTIGRVSPSGDAFTELLQPDWPVWARPRQAELPLAPDDERQPGEDG